MGRLIMMMMPITPKFIVGWVAKRYVAGPDLESAMRVMRSMKSQGACFTLDVLGEEITNLEEDMIEIMTFPEKDTIYIDFAYKGLPKNLPIESIRPFTPPESEEDKSPIFPELSPEAAELREGDDDLDISPTDIDIDVDITLSLIHI